MRPLYKPINMTLIAEYTAKICSAFSRGDATEHTHRPALKELVEELGSGIIATNEPKRQECGAPDLVVTLGHTPLGYIETKDVDESLDAAERGEQMSRYLPALGNLILTDYLEFRWYVDGDHRLTARLGYVDSHSKIKEDAGGEAAVNDLLFNFINTSAPTVGESRELAERMARLARLIRETTARALTDEDKTGSLHGQFEGFRQTLLHDLTEDQFADMYGQTICYGLFAAWCNSDHPRSFTREHAALDLPKTNPFLRKMFQHIAGYDLDDRIAWAVDDVANLLAHAQRDRILEDFGKHTRKDPVMHFYETFLAAYDPKLREMRGVYYTPEPVVSYIVRSIDHILKTDFGLPQGLADSSKVTVPAKNGDKSVHKVQILDPAAGTGTFLYGIFDRIHESFVGKQGMWSSYVREHLLPRVFGFELLMAPYAVTHMKLGLQLAESGYDFAGDERLGVYLTNTLEEADRYTGASLFAQWVIEEANAAARVKSDYPIMVVLGNPPYSGHSANRSWRKDECGKRVPTFIGKLVQDYHKVDGKPLGEKNPKWLQDDYVKFIRFAQWRIERTGHGILAFITNHGYLDNPTFRGMRRSLMNTFDDIYVLDLHGNSKKKERAPDGSVDKNVFDIQQGVAIGIFVKRAEGSRDECRVHHAELWGDRADKHACLLDKNVADTEWAEVSPNGPHYLFGVWKSGLSAEYGALPCVTDILPVTVLGFQSHRDSFAIDFDRRVIESRIRKMRDTSVSDAAFAERHRLHDNQDWQLARARADLRKDSDWVAKVQPCLYRPFDLRFCYFSEVAMDRPRRELLTHVAGRRNICLQHRAPDKIRDVAAFGRLGPTHARRVC